MPGMLFDALRILTVLCGAGTLMVSAFRFHRWFCRRPSCVAPPVIGIVVTLTLTYGAAEAWFTHTPGGVRTWLYLLGQLALLAQAFTVTDAAACRVGATGRWALPRARR